MLCLTQTSLPRVLVIDDNCSIHDDFRKLLAAEADAPSLDELAAVLFDESPKTAQPQYDLDCAESGEIGLVKVQAAVAGGRPYDLAFVDMRMPPGWDGVETIERLWKVQPDLQVVICTAHADYSWSEMIERLGATDQLLLLKKPFDPAEIYQLAAALTKKAELTRQVRHQLDDLERRVLERTHELKCAQTQLLHSEKLAAVGQLAAGIAHEINTPIQFVGDNLRACAEMFSDLRELIGAYQGFTVGPHVYGVVAEALEQLHEMERRLDLDYIFEEAPRAFADSLNGIDRVRKIVVAMKTFSHTGREGEQSVFDLNEALESTLTVATSELKYVADVERDFGVIPDVVGSPSELNQVFLNLLINAAHAIADKGDHERGVITVRTRRVEGEVVVSISDTGCGIPETVRPRIFEPFFTTKAIGRGTGQGLAIAHGIVERHGGCIAFETEVGRGTTFHLHLPVGGHGAPNALSSARSRIPSSHDETASPVLP